MRTRRQQETDAKEKKQRSQGKKPTKASLQKQKEQTKNAKKGEQVGAKKIKKQDPIQQKKKQTTTQGRGGRATKRGRQQQVRVKQSPKKARPSRGVSKQTKKPEQVPVPKQKSKPGKQKQQKKKQEKKRSPSPKLPSRSKTGNKKQEKQTVKATKKDDQKQVVKTFVMKGKAPIDDFFPLNKDNFHVLEYQGKVYSATLNQTNVMNNNNKFYLLQILQSDTNSNNCYFFTRWGRVGVNGQTSNFGPMGIQSAIMNYNSKHHQKNKKGDYREIELNYGNQDQEEKKEEKKTQKSATNDPNSSTQEEKKQSTLPKPLQNLVELIFDLNMMNKQMVQIGYNVNKMPLGKLSKQSIKKGYEVLKQLYDQIKKDKREAVIVRLTNDFYSYIPHDFGFTNMALHVLNTEQKVKSKIEMLEALAQIRVATTLLNQKKQDTNKLDSNYAKLNRKIEVVDKDSNQFKVINDYLHTTHGRHHTSYSMEIVDLFRLESQTENVRYTKDIPNKMLLWHGSRLTNFVGILSQGLRIAPPEAPVTGYMFGKGVYFADMSSKSANYCFTSRDNNTGILLLCQVALGNMNQKTNADYYAANLPPGKHSTKGLGKIVPDPKNFTKLQKEVQIPMGPGVETFNPSIYLRYNEFIVYDISQIKIKYLLRTKFDYSANNPFTF